MLTCVCRPVSGNLPKMPPASMMPASRASLGSSGSASSSSSSGIGSLGSSSDSGGGGGSGGGFGSPTRVVTSEPKLNVSKLQAINYTARKQLKRRGAKDKESKQASGEEEGAEAEVRKRTASQFKQSFATGV